MQPHLLVGELIWDFHTSTGATLEAPIAWRPTPGGAVSNVALELCSRGVGVAVGGSIGASALGLGFSASLDGIGVDVSLLARDLARTPIVFIEHQTVAHERYVAYRLGEIPSVPTAASALELRPQSLLITGVLPDETWCRDAASLALALARAGVVVGVDLNARPSVWRRKPERQQLTEELSSLLSAASWVKGSADDLRQVDPAFAIAKFAQWRERRMPQGTLIVTQADQPTLVSDGTALLSVAVSPVPIRHSVGAGDALVAGLIAGHQPPAAEKQAERSERLRAWVAGAHEWAAERLLREPPGIPKALSPTS